jgi:hypothetical protein
LTFATANTIALPNQDSEKIKLANNLDGENVCGAGFNYRPSLFCLLDKDEVSIFLLAKRIQCLG